MKDAQGPLTLDEFQALFRSVNDPSYAEPFIELGEGSGYEAHTQAMAQFARASLAVDRTTQSLYLLPFSGQTNPPAAGGQRATVELTISRSSVAMLPVEATIPAGLVIAEELLDMGPDGGQVVQTGRRFVVTQTTGLGPGDAGPITVTAAAEQIGFTYNNVGAGRITAIEQAGAGFSRGLASVVPGLRTHALILDPNPDVISAAMIGSYVQMIAGANVNAIRRIVGYNDPNAAAANPDGGTALLAATGVYRLSTVAGQFQTGETIEQPMTGATATVVYHDGQYLIADRQSLPDISVGTLIVGLFSGAVAIADSVEQAPSMVAESRTATWKILSWAGDFGLVVTNPNPPSGGMPAMLDELVGELNVGRNQGESDDELRDRGTQPIDLVTPNAILRAVNRVLVRYGGHGTLREVGLPGLPGLYYDGDPLQTDSTYAYAYDLDFTARPQDSFKLDLDYLEFRAFMLIGVPPLDLGEFGAAFDVGSYSAFDAAPWLAFFDGYPLTAASLYQTIWQEVNRTKAGGVGFDLIFDQ